MLLEQRFAFAMVAMVDNVCNGLATQWALERAERKKICGSGADKVEELSTGGIDYSTSYFSWGSLIF